MTTQLAFSIPDPPDVVHTADQAADLVTAIAEELPTMEDLLMAVSEFGWRGRKHDAIGQEADEALEDVKRLRFTLKRLLAKCEVAAKKEGAVDAA